MESSLASIWSVTGKPPQQNFANFTNQHEEKETTDICNIENIFHHFANAPRVQAIPQLSLNVATSGARIDLP